MNSDYQVVDRREIDLARIFNTNTLFHPLFQHAQLAMFGK